MMDPSSRFWFLTLKLACIFMTFTSLDAQVLSCSTVFQGCPCNPVFNDRGVLLGDSVDCSSRGLSEVPNANTSYSKPIYELKLNNNSISSLRNNILLNLNITKLDLSNNAISSVDNGTFASLGTNLKILILSGDSASGPPVNSFTFLTKVEELILKNYNVQHLTEQNGYFIPFLKLRNLTLDTWNMQSAGARSFLTTSTLLSLTLLNQSKMQELQLDSLHSTGMSDLKKLQISGTLITKVTLSAFSDLTNIQELDLSKNHIDTLEQDCFKDIEDTLIKLSLSANILTSDNSKLLGLVNLANLEELDLSYNNMVAVPNLAQLRTTKPLKLYMNNNKITAITKNTFATVADKLHTLDLSQNEIQTIDGNSFNGFTTLQVLYLSHQSISNSLVLPVSLNQIAKTLRQLHVDGQQINQNGLWPVVQQLTMLEVLNLSSTHIIMPQNMTLINLSNLKRLDISYNSLKVVTQEMLAVPHLSFLSLAGNDISTLSSCIFYQYSSNPIAMTMGGNRLNCDCAVSWLWSRIKNGSITFTQGQDAICNDNQYLADKKMNDFCQGPYQEPSCVELYINPMLTISLELFNVSLVRASWILSNTRDIKSFTITVTNSHSITPVYEKTVLSSNTSVTFTLADNTRHIVCVTAYFNTLSPVTNCAHTSIAGDTTAQQDGLSQEEIGIIIGAVIGAVVLLAILTVIGYLVFFRRNSKKEVPNKVPAQPRNFSKSELPSMNEETRTFSKPKRPRGAGHPEHRDGMQVVAISDGQTGNGRVGRAHMLNSDGSLNNTSGSKPSSTSSHTSQVNYENDHGPLPLTPSRDPSTNLPAGYYNMGYKDDTYDEISHGKESNL